MFLAGYVNIAIKTDHRNTQSDLMTKYDLVSYFTGRIDHGPDTLQQKFDVGD